MTIDRDNLIALVQAVVLVACAALVYYCVRGM
jgi:hypothetical protein